WREKVTAYSAQRALPDRGSRAGRKLRRLLDSLNFTICFRHPAKPSTARSSHDFTDSFCIPISQSGDDHHCAKTKRWGTTSSKLKMKGANLTALAVCCWLATADNGHSAVPVALQQPTATFSQSEYGDFSVARAIDGTSSDNLGWAIY